MKRGRGLLMSGGRAVRLTPGVRRVMLATTVVSLWMTGCGEAGPPDTERLEDARSERDATAPTASDADAGRDGDVGAASPDSTSGRPGRDASMVIPGGAFGPIAPDASAADLLALVGAGDIALSNVDIGEGMCAAGARLFPATPDEVRIAFVDSTRSLVASAVSYESGSRWQTPEGVRIGTSLGEIVARNGEPITFTGFAWDRGGVVLGYGDGELSYYRDGTGFFLLLDIEPDPAERELNGDRDVRSDHPLLARYEVTVRGLEAQWRTPRGAFDCELQPDGSLHRVDRGGGT